MLNTGPCLERVGDHSVAVLATKCSESAQHARTRDAVVAPCVGDVGHRRRVGRRCRGPDRGGAEAPHNDADPPPADDPCQMSGHRHARGYSWCSARSCVIAAWSARELTSLCLCDALTALTNSALHCLLADHIRPVSSMFGFSRHPSIESCMPLMLSQQLHRSPNALHLHSHQWKCSILLHAHLAVRRCAQRGLGTA